VGSAQTLELCGLYQTYRYADSLGPQLRKLLTFKPEVRREVNSFVSESRPANWTPGSYIRVGFHIRRGDFVRHDWRDVGLTVVDEGFVDRVIDYFISRQRRVQFIVATDDKHWATSVIRSKLSNSSVG
jgi:galactoside 2-L-fucosyltransferase 1/2